MDRIVVFDRLFQSLRLRTTYSVTDAGVDPDFFFQDALPPLMIQLRMK